MKANFQNFQSLTNFNTLNNKQKMYCEISKYLSQEASANIEKCYKENSCNLGHGVIVCITHNAIRKYSKQIPINAEYYFANNKYNRPIYDLLTPELKSRVTANPGSCYVVFLDSIDKIVTGYFVRPGYGLN